MGDEELQRRRAARLRERIGEIEQVDKLAEDPPTKHDGTCESESDENRRNAPAAQVSPREFIHRRMHELDSKRRQQSGNE